MKIDRCLQKNLKARAYITMGFQTSFWQIVSAKIRKILPFFDQLKLKGINNFLLFFLVDQHF
jgi:hypothetical protein